MQLIAILLMLAGGCAPVSAARTATEPVPVGHETSDGAKTLYTILQP